MDPTARPSRHGTRDHVSVRVCFWWRGNRWKALVATARLPWWQRYYAYRMPAYPPRRRV